MDDLENVIGDYTPVWANADETPKLPHGETFPGSETVEVTEDDSDKQAKSIMLAMGISMKLNDMIDKYPELFIVEHLYVLGDFSKDRVENIMAGTATDLTYSEIERLELFFHAGLIQYVKTAFPECDEIDEWNSI